MSKDKSENFNIRNKKSIKCNSILLIWMFQNERYQEFPNDLSML